MQFNFVKDWWPTSRRCPTTARNSRSLGTTSILLEKTAPQRAEKAFRDALEDHEKLVATFPGVSEYGLALGQGFDGLGGLLVRRGDLAQAYQASAFRVFVWP